jgi:4,5-DOPA dioxygenase extradiol
MRMHDHSEAAAGQGGAAPALFVSHGAPTAALERDAYTRALAAFGQQAGSPAAVLVVSGHWEVAGPLRLTATEAPRLIYDFGGFPDALYRVRYPCPGAPALAEEAAALLQAAGLAAEVDPSRGLDHGVWVPLLHVFPQAQVPVVQLSLPRGASAREVRRMGEVLRPLRRQGVLLVGSGGMVHNLRRIDFSGAQAPVMQWAQDFEAWMAERIAARDLEALEAWQRAPGAALAHPSPEHLLPLFFALGAALPGDRLTSVYEGIHYGSLSLRTFSLDS